MTKPIKVISLAVVTVLVIALVTGVAYWSVGYTPNTTTPGIYEENGKLNENPGTIMTVNGNEVSFNIYRYAYLTTKYAFTSYYGDDYFDHDPDGSLAETLAQYTEESIRQWFAWIELGEQNGIALTDEDWQEIEDTITTDKETYGEQFLTNLQNNFIPDEETYREVLRIQTLVAKVNEEYSAILETENRDTLLENIATAKHILITPDGFAARESEYEALMGGTTAATSTNESTSLTDASTGADVDATADSTSSVAAEESTADVSSVATEETTSEEVAAETVDYDARALAFSNWLYEQIVTSSDPAATFEELRLAYDEDPGQQTDDYEGYTFGEGTMVDEFYQAAISLEVGAVSEPVATTYGYHILLRLPLNETAVEEDALLSSAITNLLSEEYYAVYDAQEITYSDIYTLIEPTTIV